MYQRGGGKKMEWTPRPDGICMCQGGVVVRPPERGGIRGTSARKSNPNLIRYQRYADRCCLPRVNSRLSRIRSPGARI